KSVSRSEGSCRKVDAKAFAPDRDSPVLRRIYGVGHVIVLITDIALETTEIDVSSIFHRCVVLSIRCYQIDVNVRAVRGSEIRQAENSFTIHAIDGSRSLSCMGISLELAGQQLPWRL